MNIERRTLPALTIIGREGSTCEGPGFIQKLWAEANEHFSEIAHLIMREADGSPVGFWGAMTDFSRALRPWENDFSQGLYLAGAECNEGSEAPAGWTKWILPPSEYLKVENKGADTFRKALRHLEDNHLLLSGAVHDFICPKTGKGYLFFPIASKFNS